MSRRTRFVVILCALMAAITAGFGAQQPQPSSQPGRSIVGRVSSSGGESAAWFIVRLLDAAGTPLSLAVTDYAGEFSFGSLRPASYTIIIQAPGYHPARGLIDFSGPLTAARSNPTRTIELKLVPTSATAQAESSSRPAFAQGVPKAAHDTFERAMKLGRAGRKQVADTLMQEAIRMFPDYFDAHFALSSEFLKAGRMDEAIRELEEAIRINPRDDRVYQSFGIILMRQGKFEVAAAIFAEAARLNGAEPLHPLMRATALLDYASAIDTSQSDGAAAEAARTRAFNEAERNLLIAESKSNRQLPAVHLQLARLYQKRGERERAADELDQYLVENPSVKNGDEIREIIKRLRTPKESGAPSAPPPR